MKSLVEPAVAALLALSLLGCGDRNAAGTTGVETTNGFSMRVLDSAGDPVVGASVMARPSTWILGDALPLGTSSLVGTTDSTGVVRFPRFPSSDWTFEARKLGRAGLFSTNSGDTSFSITMSGMGTVEGMATPGAMVFVAGTVHGTSAGQGGAFTLDSLPPGILNSVEATTSGSGTATVIRYSVPVAAGDTTHILDPTWRYARSVYLNTSRTGAAVAGNLVNFPVLIRLNSANFDFSQAQSGGQDLRFTKPDDTPLAFEIERFDLVAKLAEIWVKLDTVFGNDTEQSIQMYWGAAAATIPTGGLGASVSNGTEVFDTATGFQGVWHMAQPGGDSVLDATANHYNGAPSGLGATSSISGAIGPAYAFDGTTSSIVINVPDTTNNRLNFSTSGPFTFSVWVSADSSTSASGVVWDKGYLSPSEYYLRLGTSTQYIFSITEPTGYSQRSSPAQLQTWKHVVSVRNGTQQYLYVDGICVDSVGTFLSNTLATTHGGTVYIGRSALVSQEINFFRGSIDELEISSQALGPDWIKLAYMNQRPDDKLTVFK
jgi:hypothetical protein